MSVKQNNIDITTLLEAEEACIVEKSGIRSTAKTFGLDKSTLQRYVTRTKAKFSDISKVCDEVHEHR